VLRHLTIRANSLTDRLFRGPDHQRLHIPAEELSGLNVRALHSHSRRFLFCYSRLRIQHRRDAQASRPFAVSVCGLRGMAPHLLQRGAVSELAERPRGLLEQLCLGWGYDLL